MLGMTYKICVICALSAKTNNVLLVRLFIQIQFSFRYNYILYFNYQQKKYVKIQYL